MLMEREPRVVAVVVTWNRLALLRESLRAMTVQSVAPDAVVVVDNASDDGTAEAVRSEHPAADLVVLSRNSGGAGGFAAGVRRGIDAHQADLVWLLDDDTVPQPHALERLLEVRAAYPPPAPTVLASRVVWTDGRDHPMNTPRVKPRVSAAERDAADRVGCRAIRSASFVSVLVDGDAVRERGLPIADYFLWNDDFEFTTRLLRDRIGLWCPDSVAVHQTRTFGAVDVDPGERFYFEVRNKVWTFCRSPGLSALERVIYGGSTLRRWLRTYAASTQRATVRKALVRGLADGLRTAPRATATVLAEAGLR